MGLKEVSLMFCRMFSIKMIGRGANGFNVYDIAEGKRISNI
jgi:hypothetical protein